MFEDPQPGLRVGLHQPVLNPEPMMAFWAEASDKVAMMAIEANSIDLRARPTTKLRKACFIFFWLVSVQLWIDLEHNDLTTTTRQITI